MAVKSRGLVWYPSLGQISALINKSLNLNELVLVHLKTEARFSLIQEAAPVVDSDNENYTSLNEKRESYEPYWSLQKDDVDLVRKMK